MSWGDAEVGGGPPGGRRMGSDPKSDLPASPPWVPPPPFDPLGLTAVNLLGNSFPPGFQVKTSPGWGLGEGSRGGGNVLQGWCALLSKHFFF